MRVKTWAAHTHKQGLRKGCCAQKIDMERKKKGKKNSRSVLLNVERTKECIKTIYCANHFWKLSKRQGAEKNEQPLLCFPAIFNYKNTAMQKAGEL